MSRDSSGESLESILASIRRSLAEQATTALEDEAFAPAEPVVEAAPGSEPGTAVASLDAPPAPASLTEQLAATLEAAAPVAAGLGGDAVPATGGRPASAASEPAPAARAPLLTLVASAPAPASSAAVSAQADTAEPEPAAVPDAQAAPMHAGNPASEPQPEAVAAAAGEPAAQPARVQADPLWFLNRGAEAPAARQPGAAPVAAAAQGAAEAVPPPPAAEARPARGAGIVRGPLPPFFGSPAAEVVKVEMVPDRPGRAAAAAIGPASAPLQAPAPAQHVENLHSGTGQMAGLDAAPPAAGGVSPDTRTSAIFGPPPADRPAGAADAPPVQALEAMVAELLRPMLRRWLDENMPRLVSAALQAELASRRDPKKP